MVFKKGHKTWNKNLKIQTNTGRTHFKKGHTPWFVGKKDVLKSSRKGKSYEEFYGEEKGKELRKKNNIWKNKTEEEKQILKNKIRNTLKQKYKSGELKSPFANPEILKKAIAKNKLVSQQPDVIRRKLQRRKMSSLEKKFNNIVMNNNLSYKFVGNGKFFIENKNPDFINTNGEKIAIEVYYKKYKMIISSKDKFCIGYDENLLQKYKEDRIKILSKYGWKVLFFDEIQVNEENVIKQLGEKNRGF